MMNYNGRKRGIRKPREMRWYTRGLRDGHIAVLGGFATRDEAESAGLKLTNGYYEVQLLPTTDISSASQMFRGKLFGEADTDEEVSNVFKRFKHKVKDNNEE
jgi:hypothetical protein